MVHVDPCVRWRRTFHVVVALAHLNTSVLAVLEGGWHSHVPYWLGILVSVTTYVLGTRSAKMIDRNPDDNLQSI
jgi:hypothetical protein